MIKYTCYAMWAAQQHLNKLAIIFSGILKSLDSNIHVTYEEKGKSILFVTCCYKEMAAYLYSRSTENQPVVMFISTSTLFYQIRKNGLMFQKVKRVKKDIKNNLKINN